MDQRTPEWFAARIGKITGSRIGSVLGHNEYASAEQLMRDMVREFHRLPAEFQGNEATAHGERMEPFAVAFYEKKTGDKVDAAGSIPHDEYPFIRVSPDGLVGWEGGIEVKCPYYAKKPYSVLDPKKRSYFDQCQLVMHTCGLKWLDYLCFISPRKGDWLLERIEPDQKWWDDALPKMQAFHARFLEIVASKDLSAPYLDGYEEPECDDPRLAELAAAVFRVNDMRALVADDLKLIDELKRELGVELGSVHGFGVKLKLTQKRGQIDTKRLFSDIGVDTILSANGGSLDDYRKAGTTAIEVVVL